MKSLKELEIMFQEIFDRMRQENSNSIEVVLQYEDVGTVIAVLKDLQKNPY